MAEANTQTSFVTQYSAAKDKMVAKNMAIYEESSRFEKRNKRYTPEEIDRIIHSGSLKERITLSRYFFELGGYYSQIITYYATLLKYAGILIPNPSFGQDLSNPGLMKRYNQALNFIDQPYVKTFLADCAFDILIEGCFYGLLINVNKKSFGVLKLPCKYCRTRFKDIYNNDIIEFNILYFNSIKDQAERDEALALYPQEVRSAYRAYLNGELDKLDGYWVVIPTELSVCFPFYEGGMPPFISTIPAVLQYEGAVKLDDERNLEEIKKIIVQQIPHLTDGRLLFEPDEAEVMHAGTADMLKNNKNISVLTTYADVDVVQSKTSADTTVNSTLQQKLNNIYSKSGVSTELFASSGSTTLTSSLKKDLALMMYIANKFSVFLTNLINRLFQNSNLSFKYNILPISYFNEDEVLDNSFKAASSGYSFIIPALALGLSQKDLGNVKDLENKGLKLIEKLIPLTTSYTQSNSEGGRPEVEQTEKEEGTIIKEESQDSN